MHRGTSGRCDCRNPFLSAARECPSGAAVAGRRRRWNSSIAMALPWFRAARLLPPALRARGEVPPPSARCGSWCPQSCSSAPAWDSSARERGSGDSSPPAPRRRSGRPTPGRRPLRPKDHDATCPVAGDGDEADGAATGTMPSWRPPRTTRLMHPCATHAPPRGPRRPVARRGRWGRGGRWGRRACRARGRRRIEDHDAALPVEDDGDEVGGGGDVSDADDAGSGSLTARHEQQAMLPRSGVIGVCPDCEAHAASNAPPPSMDRRTVAPRPELFTPVTCGRRVGPAQDGGGRPPPGPVSAQMALPSPLSWIGTAEGDEVDELAACRSPSADGEVQVRNVLRPREATGST